MFAVEIYAVVRRFVFIEGKSQREAARVFGLSRDMIAKMCRYTAPPGYVRSKAPERPKLGRLVPVIDAGCRVPELGGQLNPQTHVWTPEMTPKDDNTDAHITDRIDAACRELTRIADMLAGYPELHDICAS